MKLLMASLLFTASLFAGTINPPEKMKVINLDGKDGVKVSGGPFSTTEISGKVHCVVYSDPDEKDLNEEASQVLDKQKYPLDQYGSYGIINMDATWMPNFLIGEALKDKQRTYPNTKFVKDFKKIFVKEWGLKDDSNAMMVFNRKGERVFYVDGKLTKAQTEEMRDLIWKLIKQGQK